MPLALQPRLVELDKPATTWKLQGNDYYKAKNFLAALESYTQGLAECGEDEDQLRSDLLRNRSIVNLHLQRYEPAAADALTSIHSTSNDAVTIKKNNGKALYRAGCALYHQREFKKALGHFRQALDKLLNDSTLR